MSEDPSKPTLARAQDNQSRSATSPRAEIDRFLDQVRAISPGAKTGRRGRLIFALDATMSRQPTWDQACKLQAEMFREAAAIGGLDIQLVYYRGLAECRTSPWIADPDRLGALMSGIDCRGGQTQIAKILAHARRETENGKVAVLVFVGDAMEEPLDELCARAGELGLRNVKALMFQEGHDPICEQAFRESLASRAVRTAVLHRAPRTNLPSFCAPQQRMPPAGSRLWPISKRILLALQG